MINPTSMRKPIIVVTTARFATIPFHALITRRPVAVIRRIVPTRIIIEVTALLSFLRSFSVDPDNARLACTVMNLRRSK